MRRIPAKAGENITTNVIKNPCSGVDFNANVATAAASRNPKIVISTLLEAINFYQRGSGF